jgi:hypothetical protein
MVLAAGMAIQFPFGAMFAHQSPAVGHAAWAQRPERQATQTATRPAAVWTPAAKAPAGTLSHDLEAQRHDSFIARAQQGDIDLVFFGATETEMWSWQDRGRSVWDKAFGSLEAANFGSQGTSPTSLVWRMRNGELDGYQARLVVLQPFGPGAQAGNAAVIAEIRARQPQARILIVAPLPRGQLTREPWRQSAEANAAAVATLVDDTTVFYIDIGDRFFRPDGSHNQEMWRYAPLSGLVNVGAQTPAFEVWAEALQPWLDRFVR